MPTPKRITQKHPNRQPRRTRRSFLKAAAGTLAGIAAAPWLPPVALAGEANKEKRKKESPSRALLGVRCPVTGETVSKEASIDYMRGKLFFSDAECIARFRADRAAYEAKANAQLVITGQFKQTCCPLTGEEFLPAVRMKISGVDVRFCGANCLKKIKRLSADERTELVFVKGFEKAFAISQEKTAGAGGGKWQCVVCGHVHAGSSPPAKCPKCGAKSSSFVPDAS